MVNNGAGWGARAGGSVVAILLWWVVVVRARCAVLGPRADPLFKA